jgi:hypothetical protein
VSQTQYCRPNDIYVSGVDMWRRGQTGTVSEDRVLLEHGYERPSLNFDFVGKKNRYGYLIDEERGG